MCSIDIGSCYIVASHFLCSWAWEVGALRTLNVCTCPGWIHRNKAMLSFVFSEYIEYSCGLIPRRRKTINFPKIIS